MFVEQDKVVEPKPEMTISKNGTEMLRSWEGEGDFLVTPTYLIFNGVTEKYPTIGYGHYMDDGYVVINGKNYSNLNADLADQLYRQDVSSRDPILNKFLYDNNVVLSQEQYDACFIDLYQKGTSSSSSKPGWPISPAANYVKAKNYSSYNDCLNAFLKAADGSPPRLDGLKRRRTAEAILFFYGDYKMNGDIA